MLHRRTFFLAGSWLILSAQAFVVTLNNNNNNIHQTALTKIQPPSSNTLLYSSQRDNDNSFPNSEENNTESSPLLLMNRRQWFLQSAAAAAAVPTASAMAAETYDLFLPQPTLLADLSSSTPVQRHVVITGANSGVGLAGAKLLTAAGHKVTCACRTQAKAEAAAQLCNDYAAAVKGNNVEGKAVGAECNLASLASIRNFASSLKGSKVDTLVCNAGLAHGQNDKTVYRTEDGFEETIGVNHLGHFLLANLLAPTLAASAGGRLVITASPVHDPQSGGGDVGEPATLGTLQGLLQGGKNFEMVDGAPYNADKAYKDSKLCNILFMEEAARRFDGKFTVNAFSPGLIADPNGFFRYQNPQFASVFNKITKVTGVAETNEFGGAALSYLAVSPQMEGQTGGWYDSVPPGKHQLAKHLPSIEAQNIEEQRTLWKLSEALVGV